MLDCKFFARNQRKHWLLVELPSFKEEAPFEPIQQSFVPREEFLWRPLFHDSVQLLISVEKQWHWALKNNKYLIKCNFLLLYYKPLNWLKLDLNYLDSPMLWKNFLTSSYNVAWCTNQTQSIVPVKTHCEHVLWSRLQWPVSYTHLTLPTICSV